MANTSPSFEQLRDYLRAEGWRVELAPPPAKEPQMKLDPKALSAADRKLSVSCDPELGATYDLPAAITAYLASLPQSQDIRALVEELRDFVGAVYGENQPAREWAMDLARRIDALPAADALSCLAGEGWRRVPIEPTDLMLAAGATEVDRTNPYSEDVAGNIYAAMLATAPSVEEKLP